MINIVLINSMRTGEKRLSGILSENNCKKGKKGAVSHRPYRGVWVYIIIVKHRVLNNQNKGYTIMIDERKYMTLAKASRFTGLSTKCLRDIIAANKLRSYKLGDKQRSARLIKVEDLENYIQGCSDPVM
jgi:hypothetical protein